MKKGIIFSIFYLSTIYLGLCSGIDSLDVYNKIEKKTIYFTELQTNYKNSTAFDLQKKTETNIDGICVTGKGILFSDSSLIRIIVKDIFNNEYLIYESTILYDNIGEIKFANQMYETFLVDSFKPEKIIINLVDAEVKIEKITYFESTYKDINRNKIHGEIQKDVIDYRFNKVQSYIKKNKMIWSAGINSSFPISHQLLKELYGDKYNTYGIEYYKDGFFSLHIFNRNIFDYNRYLWSENHRKK